MGNVAEFRQLLEAGDVDALVAAHSRLFPHLPPPVDRDAAEATMHIARTAAPYVRFRYRAYSHSWLTERGLPSRLPDSLKPSAERIYPVAAKAVGISVNARNPRFTPQAKYIQKAMADAVEDCFANGDGDDTALVSRRMEDAKARAELELYG